MCSVTKEAYAIVLVTDTFTITFLDIDGLTKRMSVFQRNWEPAKGS